MQFRIPTEHNHISMLKSIRFVQEKKASYSLQLFPTLCLLNVEKVLINLSMKTYIFSLFCVELYLSPFDMDLPRSIF